MGMPEGLGGGVRLLRVLLAEDVSMVRGALVALLETERDLTVVASVDRGDAILPAAREHRPDVAIIDIDLHGVDGLTAVSLLRDELPACRTLILTGIGRPGTLRRALAGTRVGLYTQRRAAGAPSRGGTRSCRG